MGIYWIGSEYVVKARDQSRDPGVVSIHNVKAHMTSNDVRWRYYLEN